MVTLRGNYQQLSIRKNGLLKFKLNPENTNYTQPQQSKGYDSL